jgi:hypothetical protein
MGLIRWMVDRVVDYAVEHPPTSPEALERIRIFDLSAGISRAALNQAASSLDDDAALAALRDDLRGENEGVREAIDHLGDPRDNFLYDRAYRLLTAAGSIGRTGPSSTAAVNNR